MGTRKIKDAKDLDTGEKIYLKGHAQATYMSDGSTVEDTINQVVGGNTEKLVVTVSGISEGYTIYVMDENNNVIDSQTTSFKTYRIPAGTKYYVKGSDVKGYWTPQQSEIYTAYAYVNREFSMPYSKKYLTTIRIDQNISDPISMITRVVDEGGIEAIRANSHRYIGQFDNSTEVMTLKQLDDSDGTKYLDGTTADLTILGNDVWMKLPQFYWKCEEYATDVWDFSVNYGGKPDNTWKEWDGKDLIGVFKTCISASKVYSIPNKETGSMTFSITASNFKTYARNRGNGFTLVKWKHHCMMAMLFYTWYCNTNAQDVIGVGSPTDAENYCYTGGNPERGMVDTVNSGRHTNFWGLTNWINNGSELIDNVSGNTVIEDDGSQRTLTINLPTESSMQYVKKLLFGENIDLLPTEYGGSATTYFCDEFASKYGGGEYFIRASFMNLPLVGLVHIQLHSSSSNLGGTTSRLVFRGDIVIES